MTKRVSPLGSSFNPYRHKTRLICAKCGKQRAKFIDANPGCEPPEIECRRCDYINEHVARYSKPRAA